MRSKENVWRHRCAIILAVATLFLVALGGVVTTKGVGMAVPDWPTTYGQNVFLFPYSKWVGGVFDEHSHRLWASIVGMLTALLAGWVWARSTRGLERAAGLTGIVAALGLLGVRVPSFFVAFALIATVVLIYCSLRWWKERSLRWLAMAAFAAVIIQGVLGGLRVLLDSKGWGTEFGIFHAALAQLFFLLVGTIALFTSQWWEKSSLASARMATPLGRLVLATTCIIFLQLILGATMRHQHAGLAVPDFPLAYGKLWPATDSAAITSYNQARLEAAGEQPITAAHVVVHMLHRLTALVISILIVASAFVAWQKTSPGAGLRKLMAGWVLLVLVQVTLGAFTIWSQRKVDVTTAHVGVGALTFLLGWLSLLVSSRQAAEIHHSTAGPEVFSKGVQLKHA